MRRNRVSLILRDFKKPCRISSAEDSVAPTPKSNRKAGVTFYDTNYDNFQTELYSEIRREAFGEDIGQNSWMTASEQDVFVDWLHLSTGKKLLDIACGSGGRLCESRQRQDARLWGSTSTRGPF